MNRDVSSWGGQFWRRADTQWTKKPLIWFINMQVKIQKVSSKFLLRSLNFTGMETFHGQWHLVDTIFQNGWLLVDILKRWHFVDTFGDISWTILSTRCHLFGWLFVDIFWVNSSGHFLMVIINSTNCRGCKGKAPDGLSEHCSVPG